MNPAATRLSLIAALALTATVARAQSAADLATARDLGHEGQDALARKDYLTAEDRFRRADALYHAPTLLLGYARAEAGLGKLVNASEAYNRIIREGVGAQASTAFQAAVDAAKAEVDAVRARIASVTVTIAGPESPLVTLDGQPFPQAALGVKRPIDPGNHVVQASAEGWEPAETTFNVGEAGTASTSLVLKKTPTVATALVPAGSGTSAPAPTSPIAVAPAEPTADQPSPQTGASGRGQRTLGWITVAVGGAGLATGAIAGVLAIGKHSTLANDDGCGQGQCPEGASGDLSSYNTLGTLSTVGFIAGAALAAAGVVLVLTAPHDGGPTVGGSIAPVVGLGTVGAIGTF